MKKTLKNNIPCFVSALTAGALFLFACYHFEVFPFGREYCLFKIDLVHQYAPMLNNLYDLIKSGDSVLYSWNSGLGYSFVGNFFTYIASPFNLIVLFFSRENIPDAVSIIIMLKSMFIAGSFSYYLKKTFNKSDALNVGLSLLYAFSGWFVAYNWNIMWLDALFCLPLVAVGVQKIIDEKKHLFYTVFLAYSIFTSYYTAYMICLFLCLYFIYYYFLSNQVKKDFAKGFFKSNLFKSVRMFAVSSVAAACIVAAAILPIVFVLKKSSAVTDSINGFELFFNPLSFWAQHFSGTLSVLQGNSEYGEPNIWCGMLTVLLLPVYFISKATSKKERICDFCLWLFMVLSLGVNVLCFIWCGFHFPNGFGDRFAFIYIFVALSITFKALLNIKNYKTAGIVASSVCAIVFIAAMYFWGAGKVEKYTLIISIGFALLWTAVYFVSKIKKLDKSLLKLIVLFFICAEIIFSQLENLDFNYYRADYDGGSRQKAEAVSTIKENDSEPFFRIESADVNAHILPMIVGYEGVSDFSSATSCRVAQNQCSLGLSGNWENQYTYFLQTPVYNSIFGLKYIIDSGNDLDGSPYYEPFVKNENVSVYRNRYYLPLGYCVSETASDYKSEVYTNPFYQQNRLFCLLSGAENVFEYCDCDEIKLDNITLETEKSDEQMHTDCYYVKQNNKDEEGKAIFTFILPDDGEYYIACNYKIYANGTQVYAGENTVRRNYKISNISYEQQGISCLGMQKKGTEVKVIIPADSSKQYYPLSVYVASFNREKFIEGYNRLSKNTLKLEEFKNTHFSGTVTADEDCLLFTSIPYDKGWHITLDGKPVDEKDVIAIDDAYISIPLTKGVHTVEFDFFPQGLKAGAAVSAVSICVFTAYLIFDKKRKRGKSV